MLGSVLLQVSTSKVLRCLVPTTAQNTQVAKASTGEEAESQEACATTNRGLLGMWGFFSKEMEITVLLKEMLQKGCG
jgi:hypothetical protein